MIPDHITTPDGLRLFVQHWEIENPKAAIFLFHGLGEHIGRYEHVAAALNQAGYAVVGLDHRTHGKSEGTPRTQVLDPDVFLNDADILWEQFKTTYAGLPLIVIGHSLGGQIAVRFTLRHPSEIQALVTSGAALAVGERAPQVVGSVLKWIARRIPNVAVLPGISSKAVTRDPQFIKMRDNDPLVDRGGARLGMVATLVNGEDDALQRVSQLTLPILILHGEEDVVVPNNASKKLYNLVSSTDKTLKIYPKLHHEIFNEIERDQVIQDVIDWLNAH